MKRKISIFVGMLVLMLMMATPVFANQVELWPGSNEIYDEATGTYYYVLADEDGVQIEQPAGTWYQYEEEWYYFGENNTLVTDEIVESNGKAYYLEWDGEMVTNESFHWYDEELGYVCKLTDENGVIMKKTNTWHQVVLEDGYKFWVYFDKNGNLYYNDYYTIKGTKYYFNYSGDMAVGPYEVWDYEMGAYYYKLANADGTLNTSKNKWVYYTDNSPYYWDDETGWYYLDSNNKLVRGGISAIKGTNYYFDYNGTLCLGPCAIYDYETDTTEYWIMSTESGIIKKDGWYKLALSNDVYDENGWYYIKNGKLLTDGVYTIGGKSYYFDYNGLLMTGTFSQYEEYEWIYRIADENGVLYENCWYQDEYGDWYYALEDGVLVTDQIYKINGKEYYFNSWGELCTGLFGWYNYETGEYDYIVTEESGVIVRGKNKWYKVTEDDGNDSYWCYFGADGKLYHDGIYTISGKKYGFYGARLQKGYFQIYNEGTDRYDTYLTDEKSVVITNKTGWYKFAGQWFYYKKAGVLAADECIVIGQNEYYFDEDACMAVGYVWTNKGPCVTTESGAIVKKSWVKYGHEWYYAAENGVLIRGAWKESGGSKYYLDSAGAMATGYVVIDNQLHKFASDGKWEKKLTFKTGWQKVDGIWYYFEEAGVPYTGWVDNTYYVASSEMCYHTIRYIDDNLYMFDAHGKKVVGWYMKDGDWYYAKANGALAYEEWVQVNGSWYYFDEFGCMYAGLNTIYDYEKEETQIHYFKDNGVWIQQITGKQGWLKVEDSWFYLDAEGYPIRGEKLELNGVTYYFGWDGELQTDTFTYDYEQDKYIYVDGSGKVVKQNAGWKKFYGSWIYLDEDGQPMWGLQKINGKIYYLDPYMVTGTIWVEEYNKYCFFGADGTMQTVTTGWYSDGYNWYYFENGDPVNGYKTINGVEYHFYGNGCMDTAYVYTTSEYHTTILYKENGRVAKNQWVKIYGDWYYANAKGEALVGEHVISGKTYIFDKFGMLIE